MLRNLLHILFASWIVIASGGYAIFEHHCHCTGTDDISLSHTHICKGHKSSLESETVHSCCQQENTGQESCPVNAGDKCCDTETLLFLKTNEFTASGAILAQQPLGTDIPATVIASIQDLVSQPREVLANDSSPPLRSSNRKSILLFSGSYHSFLSC